MTRLTFLAIACALLGAVSAPAAAARRPNVIVIIADDLGYADLGFNGCKDIPTPHLDSLAQSGVRLTNGYVTHPFCSPTRAGLLTGRYQQRFGHENNPAYLPEDATVGLPLTETLLPRVLKDAGYATGAIGKWHLGAAPAFHPNERGFSEYFGFIGGGHIYLPGGKGGAEYTVPLLRNREPLPLEGYMTDVLSREAAAFITRHRSDPFCLYVAYNAVHTPLQAPEKYLSRFTAITDERRRTYAAMTSAMDDGVGEILRALREQQLDEHTLLFFISDNGGPAPAVAPTDNTPLRGHKGQVFEGGIRVPFLARWAGRVPAGRVLDQPVIALDIFATVAALAGAKPAADRPLDGVDLMPYLSDEKKELPSRPLFWRTGGGKTWAVREGRYKLLQQDTPQPQLFDLAGDVSETTDLAAQQPETVARLTKTWQAWNAQLVPPIFESPKGGKRAKPKAAQ